MGIRSNNLVKKDNQTLQNQTLEQIVNTVNSVEPNSEVYLFGSRARGNYKNHSDWDILILFNNNDFNLDNELKIMDRFYELELELGEVFSPIIYPKKYWDNFYKTNPLFLNIKNENIKLS